MNLKYILSKKIYIGKAIGLYINEIEQNRDEEIIEFRLSLFRLVKDQVIRNQSLHYTSLIDCVYSPHLEIDPSLLDMSIIRAVDSLKSFSFGDISESKPNLIEIEIHVTETNQPEATYHLKVPLTYSPIDIIIDVIKSKLSSLNQTSEQIDDIINRYKHSYVLSVCGCDEMFYGSKHSISAFKVIFIFNYLN